MRVTALMPMRHDSRRVHGKNYRPFAGEPLYRRVLSTLLACPQVAEVIVDTDSPVIRTDAEERFPGVRVIPRPPELCGEMVPMNDIIAHDIGLSGSEHFLQTHSTNPLLRPETIGAAIEAYRAGLADHDSLFSVTRHQTRLWTPDGRPLNHDPSRLERTQDLAPFLEENSCLYLFSKTSFMERRNRIGRRPILMPMDRVEALDIDTEEDFVIAELAFKALRKGDR